MIINNCSFNHHWIQEKTRKKIQYWVVCVKLYNTGTILYPSIRYSSSNSSSFTPEKSVSANNLFIVDFISQDSANVLTAISWTRKDSLCVPCSSIWDTTQKCCHVHRTPYLLSYIVSYQLKKYSHILSRQTYILRGWEVGGRWGGIVNIKLIFCCKQGSKCWINLSPYL